MQNKLFLLCRNASVVTEAAGLFSYGTKFAGTRSREAMSRANECLTQELQHNEKGVYFSRGVKPPIIKIHLVNSLLNSLKIVSRELCPSESEKKYPGARLRRKKVYR